MNASQGYLVVLEMAEKAALGSQVRQEMVKLISAIVRIGLSALMAMLMEIEYQPF